MGRLRELHEEFKDRATFLFVYITEAPHALPELGDLAVGRGPDADSAETRRRRIARGLEVFNLPFPCLVDEDGRAEVAYRAYPHRLVVVGTDGLIAYNHVGPAVQLIVPTDGAVPTSGPIADISRPTPSGPVPPTRTSSWDLKEVEAVLRGNLPRGPLH